MGFLEGKISAWEGNSTNLNQKLAEAEIKFILENFDKEQWNNNPWAQLADSTIKDKIREGYGGQKKLVRTGKLRDDISNADINATDEGYEIRIDNDYGIYHNEGTNHIPQRQFMPTSNDEPEELKEIKRNIIEEHIKNIFG